MSPRYWFSKDRIKSPNRSPWIRAPSSLTGAPRSSEKSLWGWYGMTRTRLASGAALLTAFTTPRRRSPKAWATSCLRPSKVGSSESASSVRTLGLRYTSLPPTESTDQATPSRRARLLAERMVPSFSTLYSTSCSSSKPTLRRACAYGSQEFLVATRFSKSKVLVWSTARFTHRSSRSAWLFEPCNLSSSWTRRCRFGVSSQ
mmetsp:Transcript_104154/g.335872  ORF Transcript_104154/g.335872 Transcript_104154/m.335872 type:complete len:202 (-) Transcript_104154:102-707(-)